MTSDLWKLNLQDFVRGAGNAVVGAFLFAGLQVMQGVFGAPDFNVLAVDWGATLLLAFNSGVTAAYTVFLSYVAAKFTQNKDGEFLGRWGGKK